MLTAEERMALEILREHLAKNRRKIVPGLHYFSATLLFSDRSASRPEIARQWPWSGSPLERGALLLAKSKKLSA
jgi:hypothetical protein